MSISSKVMLWADRNHAVATGLNAFGALAVRVKPSYIIGGSRTCHRLAQELPTSGMIKVLPTGEFYSSKREEVLAVNPALARHLIKHNSDELSSDKVPSNGGELLSFANSLTQTEGFQEQNELAEKNYQDFLKNNTASLMGYLAGIGFWAGVALYPPASSILLNFVLPISAALLIHQIGRGIMAQWYGFQVSETSIGIGHPLFSFKARGKECTIGMFPIGGSVTMPELRFLTEENPETEMSIDRLNKAEMMFHYSCALNIISALAIVVASSPSDDVPMIFFFSNLAIMGGHVLFPIKLFGTDSYYKLKIEKLIGRKKLL